MQENTKKKISFKVFLLGFFISISFYLIYYWKDPQIDFIPLYTVAHLWRTNSGDWYYEYEVENFDNAFVLKTPKKFEQYARNLGYRSEKYPTTLFIYFPAFIPLFALFTYLPYAMASKLMITISCFVFFFAVKKIIEQEISVKWLNLTFLLAMLILTISSPARWSIGVGQFTPYLFAGSFLSYYLQKNKKPILAGLLLSVMTWFKFFPGIFILFWLYKRDFKAIIYFILGMISIFLIGFFGFGKEIILEYFKILKCFGTGVALVWVNQSFDSFLMRFKFSILITVEPYTVPLTQYVKIISLLLKTVILLSWFFIVRNVYRIGNNESTQDNIEIYNNIIAYYLMAAMILLFPISWVHYFIFFIPLCVWCLKMFLTVEISYKKTLSIFYYISILFLFMPQNMLQYPTKIFIMLVGKQATQSIMKVLLSSHLIGGISILILSQIIFYLFIHNKSGTKETVHVMPMGN